jgi:PAS domain S-box-containing protein
MPDDDALTETSPALTGDEALRLADVSLEQGLDAVYWLDATSHIVYVNAAACRMLGYARDELVRMTAADVRPSFREDAILPGATHVSETSHRHKDGHLVEVEERATRLDTAGRRFVVVTARALPQHGQAAAPAARPVAASGAPPPGAPLRVLIVEDERIQQRIIRDMLERLGAIVETAATGREAVESVRKGPDRFGAILMDMLMPEMDGIEAARIIRREFPDHAVPIIATTASAQPAEIDACLAAGMNGHVSKPFDVRQLEAALSRWMTLAPTARGPQGVQPDTRAQGAPADLSAVKGVDAASALARLNGHRDLFVRLLKGFVDDYRSAPASIGAAIARGDLDAALRLAHNLKGVAGTLSANAVHGAARALEASLRDGRHDVLPEFVERLREELDTVCRSVADWATQNGAATGRSGRRSSGPSAAAAALAEFDRRLKTRRFSAREQFEVVKEHAADPSFENALDAVQRCLDRLDFRQARELLPALAAALGVPFSQS